MGNINPSQLKTVFPGMGILIKNMNPLMGFSTLIRWHLHMEIGPWFTCSCTLHFKYTHTQCVKYCHKLIYTQSKIALKYHQIRSIEFKVSGILVWIKCMCSYGLRIWFHKEDVTDTTTTRWSLVHPKHVNTTSLAALYDEELNTCVEVNLNSGETLLKASIDPVYDLMNVSIVVSGNDVMFGPNPDPTKCATTTSMLMTHHSSNGHVNCRPFNATPRTCLVKGNEIVGAVNRWFFSCACPRRSCNELFLSVRSGLPGGQASLCEITLRR